MSYNRFHGRSGYYGSHWPIKRICGTSPDPLYLDIFSASPQRVYSREMTKYFPAIMNDFRSSGNRIIDPLKGFPEAYDSTEALEDWQEGMEWIRQVGQGGCRNSKYNSSFGGQLDVNSQLRQRFQLMKTLIVYDHPFADKEVARNLRVLDALTKLLDRGGGLSPHLDVQLFGLAQSIAPILAHFHPIAIYQLIRIMHRASRRDPGTVRRLVESLDLQRQAELLAVAQQEAASEGDYTAWEIILYIGDIPDQLYAQQIIQTRFI